MQDVVLQALETTHKQAKKQDSVSSDPGQQPTSPVPPPPSSTTTTGGNQSRPVSTFSNGGSGGGGGGQRTSTSATSFSSTPLAPRLSSEPESYDFDRPPPRARQRSLAFYDWFAEDNNPVSSSSRRTSPTRAGSGDASGRIEEEDEGGQERSQEREREQERQGGFRGPFRDEDTQRGEKIVRKMSRDSSIQASSTGKRKPPQPKRSVSVGGFTRRTSSGDTAIAPGGASNGLSMVKGKGRAREGSSGGEGSEWEDVLGASFDPDHLGKRPEGTPRKQSLWAALPSRMQAGPRSGYSTPDNDDSGSEHPKGTSSPRPKPMRRATTAGWTAIRNRLKSVQATDKKNLSKTLTGHELITELTTGVLPLVIVKMGTMDRDEHGEHRIPILMNYLKLRVTDSIYPLHDRHAVFRIELEYGDGLIKWVIYRELRDFVNLHAHYRVSNLRHGIEKFPTFPKTSIPYLNWLKSEARGPIGKADFARAQRAALETYLLKLIRATMFGPGANRLCKFFEISAMSTALATAGGEQGKQGYLRIMSSGASRRKEQGFHPLSWKTRHNPKWFIVRDSYIVAVTDPASTEIYEVFMIDSHFELIRPKRLYRQGLKLFGHDSDSGGEEDYSKLDEQLKDEKQPAGHKGAGDPLDPSTTNESSDRFKDSSNHTFYLKSSERRLRLVAKTERQQDQFIASIEKMVSKSIWAGKNRFDSFAPIRMNVAAQWLVDGRDYFWSLSRAIMLAKKNIYIHDWWLSPELYLRRPAAENEKWRLDRLLQRKAQEGVQIFVIVYKEVSNDFTPVDSTYTKTRLRGLHPNIHVQRSPSHTSAGTLLWSHHEKMCVIDETIGFMGGIDLCFGRWDTPGHVLVDDGIEEGSGSVSGDSNNGGNGRANPAAQIWPGKDYSNQRVLDFHTLNKPDEDMYDRTKVPRQPWHDVGLQIIGQPARDLCRHFIQRWNYLLRTKNHTVDMPFLLPAAEFTAAELQEQRITGTCEVQICRSVGPWSMGIGHTEHSIQNAYIKAIQLSDHFVYIENQFFISSTEVEGTVIENKIGDALVSRILRAHSEGTPWRAMIVMPLVPGYPYPIDHSDAGSVRLIMECQNRTISHGPHSIFGRLRRQGINPDDYISFFGLRGWGKLATGALTTEAIYIHDKIMIVDDRIAIIGSANINERSQRGDRDSELACIIRDTDMIDSTMAGEPYQVGRFAHTMRLRLMREHLGVDVDDLDKENDEVAGMTNEPEELKDADDAWDPDDDQRQGVEGLTKVGKPLEWAGHEVKAAAESAGKKGSIVKQHLGMGGDKLGAHSTPLDAGLNRVKGDGTHMASTRADVPTLEEEVLADKRHEDTGDYSKPSQAAVNAAAEDAPSSPEPTSSPSNDKPSGDAESPELTRRRSAESGHLLSPIAESDGSRPNMSARRDSLGARAALQSSIGGSLRRKLREKPSQHSTLLAAPKIDLESFVDPVDDAFYRDVWLAIAVRNTQAYRNVFRCVPDDLVQTWKQYREFQTWAERHNKAPKDVVPPGDEAPHSDPSHHSGQHGAGGGGSAGGVMGQGTQNATPPVETMHRSNTRRNRASSSAGGGERRTASGAAAAGEGHDHDQGFPVEEREQMEGLLAEVQGTLVVYPTKFLEAETNGGNFLFSKDRLPPLAIYD